jgi:putative hydrolase of the HAD superfamily
MIKAIIFDFGQTLVDSSEGFRQAEMESQAAIFQDLLITDHDSFKNSYRRIRKAFHQESNLSRVNIWKAVYREFSREASLVELLKWELAYWQTVERHTKVFPEVMDILKILSGRYEHLALITNTQGQTNTHAHRLKSYPDLAAFFSVMVVAGEDGVPPKPDTRSFYVCLEQLGVAPDEAVYIGDDWQNDVIGSRDAGLFPIWLKHQSVNRNYPEVKEDISVIYNLTELPPFLEKLQKKFQECDVNLNLPPKTEDVKFEEDSRPVYTISNDILL